MSLASLSLTAGEQMSEDPLFNIYRHTFQMLGERSGGSVDFFGGRPIEEYGNTIVNGLFGLEAEHIETQAALILNVFMSAIHQLYEVMAACDYQNSEASMAALDRAAALWIGEGQRDGSNEHGNLLYNLAEKAGERFGQDEGETLVNTRILNLLNSLQTNLLSGNYCMNDRTSLPVRMDVHELIELMTIPLLQDFIHHIVNVENENGSDFVNLYALALIPRVIACDPSAYENDLNFRILNTLTPEERQSTIIALQSTFSCFRISCAEVGSYMSGKVPQCDDESTDLVSLAGYTTPRQDVRYKSYLDRDILQMEIFMNFSAYRAAMDLYQHGYNSVYSLQRLALNEEIPEASNSLFEDFQAYYLPGVSLVDDSSQIADYAIISALTQHKPFEKASPDQLSEIVLGLLKYVVLYLSVITSLQFAVQECWNQETESSLDFWDMGAAFFIGSLEGSDVGGRDGGQFLYGTAKTLCDKFGTCDGEKTDSNAVVNNEIVDALTSAVQSLASGNCEAARVLLEERIISTLPITLIQGCIAYALIDDGLSAGSPKGSLGTGHAFSRSVLPLLSKASSDNAQLIDRNMAYDLNSTPVADGFSVVIDAFRRALEVLPTNCADIGTLALEPESGVCQKYSAVPPTVTPATLNTQVPTGTPTLAPEPAMAPTQAQVPVIELTRPPVPTVELSQDAGSVADLAFGRYAFSIETVADGFASFALDVRDMTRAATIDDAQTIYENGSHARASGFSDEESTTSLASFSTDAVQYMSEDPMFNIFKYALYDDSTLEDTFEKHFAYADEVVIEALVNGRDQELAAEAAVVLNVWMMIAHKLHSAVRECKQGTDARRHIDAAVALWIGKEQDEGSFNNSGWMLYSVAQQAAERFGHDEGEAEINFQLMRQFNEIQELTGSCSTNPDVHLEVRLTVSTILRMISIPLVQNLLYFIARNRRYHVELYAVAVISQCSACHTEAYLALSDVLYAGFSHNNVDGKTLDYLVIFLQCLRISCQDLHFTDNADQALKSLVVGICERLNERLGETPLLTYVPSTDIREQARIDLDIFQIGIFMRTKAYGLALDYYMNGQNSLQSQADGSTNKLLSLHSLATGPVRERASQFEIFSQYFGSENYADDIILNALSGDGSYKSASRRQLASIVITTLQTMVSYMAVLGNFQSAIDGCQESKLDHAKKAWDTGVALFVGSIAANVPGHGPTLDGVLLYSLGLEQCLYFGTCLDSGGAIGNAALLDHFSSGRDLLHDAGCDQVEKIFNSRIVPLIQAPLIQATLHYSLPNNMQTGETNDGLAAGHILASAVQPLVNEGNATSAKTLAHNFAFPSESTVDDVAVFEAFSYVLDGMNIDCSQIGFVQDKKQLSVCMESSSEIYITTTYVQDRSNIGLDVNGMISALEDGQAHLAAIIYSKGLNSEIFDEKGQFVKLRNLQGLSTDASLDMFEDPLFNIFLFAQRKGDSGSFLQRVDGRKLQGDTRTYADSIVQESFQVTNEGSKTIPAEAAVALNVWMYLAHLLYQSLRNCKNEQIYDTVGVHSIDEAVAYWIGDGKVEGDREPGHLLYALAEEMGKRFHIDQGGQSKTNTNIFRLFNEAKKELMSPNACLGTTDTFTRLHAIVNKIISQMAIPLIQGLIHNLRVNDRDRVRLYAHAFVPLVAACNSETFDFLHDRLVNLNYNVVDLDIIVQSIWSTFSCLGIKCDDVGVHESEVHDRTKSCIDPPVLTPLASYRPSSEVQAVSVKLCRINLLFCLQMSTSSFPPVFICPQYSQLDLDLLEIDILMQMNAYDAATDLYMYGKHGATLSSGRSGEIISLANLANISKTTIIPQFDSFVRYYGSGDLVHEMVLEALAGSDEKMTRSQRRVLVARSSQVLIMYFAALERIYQSVENCESDSSLDLKESWDEAASFLIGSLEGTQEGGSEEGYMYFDLAQEYCQEFGTCSKDHTAWVNDNMISLLYTGRGAAMGYSCGALRKAADGIGSLLLIPVIQATLSASLKLSQYHPSDEDTVEAYVFSRILVPLVEAVNPSAATKISTTLDLEGNQVSKSTGYDMFKAFSQVYEGLGIDCKLVGQAGGFDTCNVDASAKGAISLTYVILFAISGIAVVVAAILVFRYKCRSIAPLPSPADDGDEDGKSLSRIERKSFLESRISLSRLTTYVGGGDRDSEASTTLYEEDDDDEATVVMGNIGRDDDII
jgi:hypothetical protein